MYFLHYLMLKPTPVYFLYYLTLKPTPVSPLHYSKGHGAHGRVEVRMSDPLHFGAQNTMKASPWRGNNANGTGDGGR